MTRYQSTPFKNGIALAELSKHVLFSVQGADMKVTVLITKDKVLTGSGRDL